MSTRRKPAARKRYQTPDELRREYDRERRAAKRTNKPRPAGRLAKGRPTRSGEWWAK